MLPRAVGKHRGLGWGCKEPGGGACMEGTRAKKFWRIEPQGRWWVFFFLRMRRKLSAAGKCASTEWHCKPHVSLLRVHLWAVREQPNTEKEDVTTLCGTHNESSYTGVDHRLLDELIVGCKAKTYRFFFNAKYIYAGVSQTQMIGTRRNSPSLYTRIRI